MLTPTDWTADIANDLAINEGITLTEAHWDVLHSIRRFYDTYETSPSMRLLCRWIKTDLDPEKGNSLYLLSLFPDSPAKITSKVAGLPKPDNCL